MGIIQPILMMLGKHLRGTKPKVLPDNVDVVVVLGGKILADGSPGSGLVKRVLRAAELLDKGMADNVILSGGIKRQTQSESTVMEEILESHLARSDLRVVLENQSETTLENARNCSRIMKDNEWYSAIIVTSPYHVPRAVDAFRCFGVDAIGCQAFTPDEYTDCVHLRVILYELGARVKYQVYRGTCS
jgi:uncharacterized SAM-binding protein YcdF (DUF218 family)